MQLLVTTFLWLRKSHLQLAHKAKGEQATQHLERDAHLSWPNDVLDVHHSSGAGF